MILTRTPLRLSLGGGGTDHPAFFRRYGGLAITATITPSVYLAAKPSFTSDYFCRYQENERVDDPSTLKHDLMRAVLSRHQLPPLELVSVADVPAGTGLGSSGAFLIGLLRLIYAWKGELTTSWALAAEAAEIEIDVCGHRVGLMDPYACAFGGFMVFRFGPGDQVTAEALRLSSATLAALRRSLRLFYVGQTHSADAILAHQHAQTQADDVTMLGNLDATKRLGERILTALEEGDVPQFARLLGEHWRVKSTRSPGITSPRLQMLYELAERHGVHGGKLVGAGGGGFFLFSVGETPAATLAQGGLAAVLAREGLKELPFDFTDRGTEVLLADPVAEAA